LFTSAPVIPARPPLRIPVEKRTVLNRPFCEPAVDFCYLLGSCRSVVPKRLQRSCPRLGSALPGKQQPLAQSMLLQQDLASAIVATTTTMSDKVQQPTTEHHQAVGRGPSSICHPDLESIWQLRRSRRMLSRAAVGAVWLRQTCGSRANSNRQMIHAAKI
jgi:hypothetical protein